MRKLTCVTALSLLAGCSGPAPAPAAAPTSATPAAPAPSSKDEATLGKPVLVAEDTERVTAGGIRYIIPAAWTALERGPLVQLSAQEQDAHFTLIEPQADDADAALAEAWHLYRTAPPPPLKFAIDAPGGEGWDAIRKYDYAPPPNAKRTLGAAALRHGGAWLVVIWDGSDATFSRRGAQFGLVSDSLKPTSFQRESFAGKAAHTLDAARLSKLDELVELGREKLGVPGVAVALVQGGKVIHARGYGQRELGKPAKVDADTAFPIASNTKALTTLLLAQLVDEGKLRWDEPVREAYPEFQLGDAATTAATRVEHLVCACTGLPRKDMEWIFEYRDASALGTMARLARVQPTTKFGETYQYSNLLGAAAGYVAGHVVAPGQELGKAYDAAMASHVFAPLGMRHTTFDFDRALRGNHASPHALDIDGHAANAVLDINRSMVSLRPSGGAWSSANDLIQYVRLELAKGIAPSGKRIVSEQSLLQRRKPYAKVGELSHYGMGLTVDRRYEITTINHGGSLFGYKSQMVWLPEHDVGAVILTNSNSGDPLLTLFYRYWLELLFDGKPEAIENLHTAARVLRGGAAAQRQRITLPPEQAALQSLARRYQHVELGALQVRREASSARFDFGEWGSAVATRKNDDGTTSFVTIAPGTLGFEFVVGTTSGKRTLTLREEQHEYVFLEAD